MAATDTRMLVLGAVAMFGPVNGYQIRRELVSWEIDKWAHVNPGSIYSTLTTLERKGWVVRRDLVDVVREVAVYETTAAGREQLVSMLDSALRAVDPYNRIPFHIAFGMLPLLSTEQVRSALEHREVELAKTLAGFPEPDTNPPESPPHAFRGLMLWRAETATELTWLRGVLGEIRAGTLRFQMHEDWGWEPAPDDPGRQMQSDRARYLRLLGR